MGGSGKGAAKGRKANSSRCVPQKGSKGQGSVRTAVHPSPHQHGKGGATQKRAPLAACPWSPPSKRGGGSRKGVPSPPPSRFSMFPESTVVLGVRVSVTPAAARDEGCRHAGVRTDVVHRLHGIGGHNTWHSALHLYWEVFRGKTADEGGCPSRTRTSVGEWSTGIARAPALASPPPADRLRRCTPSGRDALERGEPPPPLRGRPAYAQPPSP